MRQFIAALLLAAPVLCAQTQLNWNRDIDKNLCQPSSASGTAYTCTTSPHKFTPAAGSVVWLQPDVANTGSAALNVNSTASYTIRKPGGTANLTADYLAANAWVMLMFDGTYWQLLTLPQAGATIAAGTVALATSSIASGACATAASATVTTSAGVLADVLTTDVLTASFNSDPTGVTGYVPSTNGMLSIVIFPASGGVSFRACNNTASPVTPQALTLNWRVVR